MEINPKGVTGDDGRLGSRSEFLNIVEIRVGLPPNMRRVLPNVEGHREWFQVSGMQIRIRISLCSRHIKNHRHHKCSADIFVFSAV